MKIEKNGSDISQLLSQKGSHSKYGVASVAEGIRLARDHGSGYVAFVILNPEKNVSEPKLGYIERVDENWFVGSGWYFSDFSGSNMS